MKLLLTISEWILVLLYGLFGVCYKFLRIKPCLYLMAKIDRLIGKINWWRVK